MADRDPLLQHDMESVEPEQSTINSVAIDDLETDANADDERFADAVGDEAVGGTTAVPEQNIVEDLAVAVGIQTDDRSYLRTNDMMEQRDDQRWELDPKSSEDYEEHQE